MLRTIEKMAEDDLENVWNNVKYSTIGRLRKTFQKHPNCFFTEHDIHSVLYSITKEGLQRSGASTERTRDGHRVLLVHHEYPTPFRCDMHDHEFRRAGEEERTSKGGRYQRGHYDLVILNPKFVKNDELDIVCGKDYQKFTLGMERVKVEPLIWACEVIFFPRVKKLPKNAIKTIEQDALKVKETLRFKVGQDIDFCKMGSVLVFTSHTAEGASNLERLVAELGQEMGLEIIFSQARE